MYFSFFTNYVIILANIFFVSVNVYTQCFLTVLIKLSIVLYLIFLLLELYLETFTMIINLSVSTSSLDSSCLSQFQIFLCFRYTISRLLQLLEFFLQNTVGKSWLGIEFWIIFLRIYFTFKSLNILCYSFLPDSVTIRSWMSVWLFFNSGDFFFPLRNSWIFSPLPYPLSLRI